MNLNNNAKVSWNSKTQALFVLFHATNQFVFLLNNDVLHTNVAGKHCGHRLHK